MSIIRFDENPLIRPADVKPSRADFEVVCAFNTGCARVGDEILLLIQVAERSPVGPDEVVTPILDPDDPSRGIQLLRVSKNDPEFEEIDSRVFSYKNKPYLTSFSHLRVARSKDGRNFVIDDKPAMAPEFGNEEYSIEDPRIPPPPEPRRRPTRNRISYQSRTIHNQARKGEP